MTMLVSIFGFAGRMAVALILWSVFGRRLGLAALAIAVVIAVAVGVS